MNIDNKQIVRINARLKVVNEELQRLETAKKALQDICDHTFQHVGNDSHYDYFECIHCGLLRCDR